MTRHREWTEERIIASIQFWTETHGRPPRAWEWKRSGEMWPTQTTVINVFKSWANAIEAAGFTRPMRGPDKQSDVALRAEIEELKQENQRLKEQLEEMRKKMQESFA